MTAIRGNAGGQLRQNSAIGRASPARVASSISTTTVGLLDRAPRALDADAFHGIVGLAQARRIDDMQRHPVEVDRSAVSASRVVPGMSRHDREVLARQAIEQARLADVGLPGEHDVHAFAQETPLPRRVQHRIELLPQPRSGARCVVRLLDEVDLLLGKIQRRFDERAQLDELAQ